ncbi:MAG: TadE family protein [Chloroflexota bacterium]|nr:TadE family protein [Chloroflexota bacterium]
MKYNRHSSLNEKGQSLTELATTLVFMLILLAGIVELSRAFFAYIAIRDAAQEGASYGSVCPSGDIEGRVRDASSNPVDLSDTTNVTVSVSTTGSGVAGDGVQVTVAHDFHVIMPFLGTIIGSQTINISTTVIDTILTTACP